MKPENKTQLLKIARQSIRYGLEHGKPLPIQCQDHDPELQQIGASFVTLQKQGALRGCIGSLEAREPLVEDVARNAFNAAFRDPRFPPVSESELPLLDIHISILSTPEPVDFSSEADLISQLRPFVDGLVLSDGFHRGTFLPSVWEQLPEPEQFLQHLKVKAGLPPDYWSNTLKVERYTVESLQEH